MRMIQAMPTDERDAVWKLLEYCRANDFGGHDPYDALNSRVLARFPGLDHKACRLLLTQILKRSPIDLRQLLFVPKTKNPKALALALSASLLLSREGHEDLSFLAVQLIEQLIEMRAQREEHWCWGYSFPWQTRSDLVPAGSPNLVCTVFVADALLHAYEYRQDPRYLEMAKSAAEYVADKLYWSDGATVASFSYPLPSMNTRVHNANFLAAALLCRVYRQTGQEQLLHRALAAARYSTAQQHEDGSWDYGDAPKQRWIDNFHTGYNLCALRNIGRTLDTEEFEPAVRSGFRFYRDHFFRKDGAPRYFHDRDYPIDIHCVAQSILTLVALKDLDSSNLSLARAVARWAMAHMWDKRGYFYYRVLRSCTIRTSYMRWSQVWMLLALATLLREPETTEARELSTVFAER
jgi:hypothetical protein